MRALTIVFAAALAAALPAAGFSFEAHVHYSPDENLEKIDIGLLDSAGVRVNMAVFTLNDWAVIEALEAARARGVAVRIVLDPSQRFELERLRPLGASVRVKRPGAYMHQKYNSVDGEVFRSGSANLSASGLKRQDNDLIIIRDPSAARAFDAHFEGIWAAAMPLAEFEAQGGGRRK